MKQGWTKEPWKTEEDGHGWMDILGSETEPKYGEKRVAIALGEPNAKRISKCVNALVGIEDPEAFVKAAKLNAKIVRLIFETKDVVFDDPGHAAKLRELIKETDPGNLCYMDFG